MNEKPTVSYAFALKNYSQNGKGRSIKKFCEEEGYDYDKFLQRGYAFTFPQGLKR